MHNLKMELLVLLCAFDLFVGVRVDELTKEEVYYQNHFKTIRPDQEKKLTRLLKKNPEEQTDFLLILGQELFAKILRARAIVENAGFVPGISDFPQDPEIRHALCDILENAALFSDILLRLPDLTHSFLEANNNWNVLFQWSLVFANLSGFLIDKETLELLLCATQELIDPAVRDPNYRNPYFAAGPEESATQQDADNDKREGKISGWGQPMVKQVLDRRQKVEL